MTLAPIALFCYRRLDVLTETIEALKNNEESKESLLFIFSDGFKSEEDKKDVEEVRKYLKTIDGFKKVEIIESDKNKGLANSIIDGVTRIINEYGKIIVVEDDILTSPYFLKFMNDALDMYENNDDVACISGYIYPIKTKEQTFFIKGADCWGWASWKRAWDLFEVNGQKLLDEIKDKKLDEEFDFGCTCPYLDMLKFQIEGKNNSWAIRWYASCFLKDKLCLYPGKSLVQNIGVGVKGATHCNSKSDMYDTAILDKPIDLIKIETKENKSVKKLIAHYFDKTLNTYKGNFFYKKRKCGNKRIITILGFISIKYKV